MVDVDAINHVVLDATDAVSDGAGDDLVKQPLALSPGELLGIVDAFGQTERVKDDGGGDDGAGNRPAPDFVRARDQPMPGGKQPALDSRVTRHEIVGRRQEAGGSGCESLLALSVDAARMFSELLPASCLLYFETPSSGLDAVA